MDVMDVCITLVVDLDLLGTKDPQPCARRKFERFLGLSKLGNTFLEHRPHLEIKHGPQFQSQAAWQRNFLN